MRSVVAVALKVLLFHLLEQVQVQRHQVIQPCLAIFSVRQAIQVEYQQRNIVGLHHHHIPTVFLQA